MRGFEVKDIVRAHDGSGVMGLDEKGKLNVGIHGTCIKGRDFEVIAINCDLPVRVPVCFNLSDYDKNNLMLRALDNNQVIFITSNQVKLKHRCGACPSCGQELN